MQTRRFITQANELPRHLRDAGKVALSAQWKIRRTGGGHLQWKPPTGPAIVTPSTPSGGNRSIENTMADLRRAGLEVKK